MTIKILIISYCVICLCFAMMGWMASIGGSLAGSLHRYGGKADTNVFTKDSFLMLLAFYAMILFSPILLIGFGIYALFCKMLGKSIDE